MNDTTKAPPVPAAAPTTSNIVVVGCKLPSGMICEMGKPGNEGYARVVLNGSNSARVIGGYGLTEVARDFWEAWLKKNARLEFVQRGFVFAHNDAASATAHANERAAVVNGMEPLDPMKKILGADGKPLLEGDMAHMAQAKQDAAQFGGGARRAAR